MKNIFKLSILLILLLSSIAIIYINYIAHFSEEAIVSNKNIKKSKLIEKGMNYRHVITIMGKPDSIIGEVNTSIFYKTNDQSFGDIQIQFDSACKVVEIFRPEDK